MGRDEDKKSSKKSIRRCIQYETNHLNRKSEFLIQYRKVNVIVRIGETGTSIGGSIEKSSEIISITDGGSNPHHRISN